MTEHVTTAGVVATDPRHLTTQAGLPITSFRLAADQRRYNREKGEWETTETNWFTVSVFRKLAQNVAASIRKGDRVVVAGRLRVRSWESGDRGGITVEIDAEAVGHDLTWGTSTFVKNPVPPRPGDEAQPGRPSPEEASGGDGFVPDAVASPRAEGGFAGSMTGGPGVTL